MKFCAVLLLALALLACDSSPAVDTGATTTTHDTTTTTIDNDTCQRVAEDTTEYLERLIDTLDDTRLRVLLDTGEWPQNLRELQRQGKDLDLRVAALRCDPAAIQEYAFTLADMAPGGPLSEQLLDLLLSDDTPTTEAPGTTMPATSTTSGETPSSSTPEG